MYIEFDENTVFNLEVLMEVKNYLYVSISIYTELRSLLHENYFKKLSLNFFNFLYVIETLLILSKYLSMA